MASLSPNPKTVFCAHLIRLPTGLRPIWPLHSSWYIILSLYLQHHPPQVFSYLHGYSSQSPSCDTPPVSNLKIRSHLKLCYPFSFYINPNAMQIAFLFVALNQPHADASLNLHIVFCMISRLNIHWKSIWTSHRNLKLRISQGKFDFSSKICSSFRLFYFSKRHHQASMTKARMLESLLSVSFIALSLTCILSAYLIDLPPKYSSSCSFYLLSTCCKSSSFLPMSTMRTSQVISTFLCSPIQLLWIDS